MSRPTTIICDAPGCGKQKQDANHWWIAGVAKPGAMGQHRVILVAPFTENSTWDERFTLFDFCGHECALKFISEQMGKHGEETA